MGNKFIKHIRGVLGCKRHVLDSHTSSMIQTTLAPNFLERVLSLTRLSVSSTFLNTYSHNLITGGKYLSQIAGLKVGIGSHNNLFDSPFDKSSSPA